MKQSKVLIFGTFDILHQGHVHMFDQARKYGNYLIAIIARDKTLKETGKKPSQTEQERKKKVAQYVDKALLGNIKDKMAKIKLIKPDVIALGYDQELFIDQMKKTLKKHKLKTKVVKLTPHKAHIYKSSLLRK